MSKFERYKKKGVSTYIYPHKHCTKCAQMIDESLTYCPQCYQLLQQKKQRKRFGRKKVSNEYNERSEHIKTEKTPGQAQ